MDKASTHIYLFVKTRAGGGKVAGGAGCGNVNRERLFPSTHYVLYHPKSWWLYRIGFCSVMYAFLLAFTVFKMFSTSSIATAEEEGKYGTGLNRTISHPTTIWWFELLQNNFTWICLKMCPVSNTTKPYLIKNAQLLHNLLKYSHPKFNLQILQGFFLTFARQ